MRNGIDEKAIVLQPRDQKLLEVLVDFRFVDRIQASKIVSFTSASRAKTRLLALVRAGHLARFFVGTINGGRKAIYCLPLTRKAQRESRMLTSAKTERFVEHQLCVNELYLILSKGSSPTLIRWERVADAIPDKTGVIPDAYAEITSPAGRAGMFIEVDLGTEALSVWAKKVDGYLKLARSGIFSERFGLPSFRVLVVAKTEDRINAIRSMIAKQTDRVFWVATTESINREGFWSPIWLRPNGVEKHSLL